MTIRDREPLPSVRPVHRSGFECLIHLQFSWWLRRWQTAALACPLRQEEAEMVREILEGAGDSLATRQVFGLEICAVRS